MCVYIYIHTHTQNPTWYIYINIHGPCGHSKESESHNGNHIRIKSSVCVCLHVCIMSWLCMCLVAKSCQTLCDPLHYSLRASSVHDIFQARMLEWVAFSTPGDLPDTGIEHGSLVSPALAGRFFPTRYLPGKPTSFIILDNKHISICIKKFWHLLGGSVKKHIGNVLILCCLIWKMKLMLLWE